MNENTFDKNVNAFEKEQIAPWGKLRYKISYSNIQRHISGQSLRILDVGGGNGLDTIAFAEQGHRVDLLDSSEEMLAEASRKAERYNLSDQINFHKVNLFDIPTVFNETKFDVIVCHHVLQYVDEIDVALDLMLSVLCEGGVISIMSINRYSEAYRQAFQVIDLDAAIDTLDAKSIRAVVFGTDMKVYSAEEMKQLLEKVGYEVVGEYGVRCICDYISDNDLKSNPDFFAKLEKLEYEVTDKYPYYLLARNFQLVGCKVSK